MNKGLAVCLVMLLGCISCGDADLFDTDKWTNKVEGLEPGVTLKVLHGSFELWDLINQGEDSVIIKEGNELAIQYLKEDIYKIRVSEVFDMPAENIGFQAGVNVGDFYPDYSGETLVSPIGFSKQFSQPLTQIPDGCELRKITASATLNYALPATGFQYTVIATFKNIQDADGQPFRITETVGRTSAVEKTKQLNGITVVLDENTRIDLEVKIDIPGGETIQSGGIAMVFELDNLSFLKAEGKIVVEPITIKPGEFDMDVDFLNEIEGDFAFAKPELSIILRNKGIGVPMEVDATFDGRNAEGTKEMTLALKDGKKLTTQGNKENVVVNDTLRLNAANSNIVDFLSMPPQGDITYQGKVYVNREGADNNVVYSDAEATLDAYVRIPFSLSAKELKYRDTLNDIDIDQKYADKIKKGKLVLQVTNGLPLKISIPTLTLLDENGSVIENLQAVKNQDYIGAGGNPPAKRALVFELTQQQAAKLGRTENILLEVVASTPEFGTETIDANAVISFELLLSATASITDLDDF